eukprot:365349-Chlamydomonas_euryale.AAC.9
MAVAAPPPSRSYCSRFAVHLSPACACSVRACPVRPAGGKSAQCGPAQAQGSTLNFKPNSNGASVWEKMFGKRWRGARVMFTAHVGSKPVLNEALRLMMGGWRATRSLRSGQARIQIQPKS